MAKRVKWFQEGVAPDKQQLVSVENLQAPSLWGGGCWVGQRLRLMPKERSGGTIMVASCLRPGSMVLES